MDLKKKVLDINKPGKGEEKAKYVRGVFDAIAPKYDLMNGLMSFGMHGFWRKYAARKLGVTSGAKVLDGCTGTCDFAIASAHLVGKTGQVVAFDFCHEMVKMAPPKIKNLGYKDIIRPFVGDTTCMALPSNYFDFVTVGCGIRNLKSLEDGLAEVYRVLKPGGTFGCLDLGRPNIPIYSELYYFYFFNVVPKIGKLVMGDEEPYAYLPNSLHAFPKQEELKKMMEEANFEDVHYINLAGGAMALHIGTKPYDDELDKAEVDDNLSREEDTCTGNCGCS